MYLPNIHISPKSLIFQLTKSSAFCRDINSETITMALASSNTRQRLSDVKPDGANYFMEKLLFQIYEHFDEQYLVDITFKLSNPTALVTAHRLILSAASPYFKELFKTDTGSCSIVEIADIDSDIFERLITFCYSGKTLLTINNVDRMLKAALLLRMDDAINNCIDFLIEHVTDYTLERVYALESETRCTLLSEKILKYEIANFMSVFHNAEFFNIDAHHLQKILESDDLNVPTEKEAFEAVKRWYEHDASARKQELPDLIACLRLTQFDTKFLLSSIQPLPGCHCLAVETLAWISHPLARSSLSMKHTKPRARQSPNSEKSLLALNIEGKGSRTIFKYNKTEALWQKLVDIEIDVQMYRVTLMNENLFFTGGNRNGRAINEVRGWNIKTKSFQLLPSMNQPRYSHCVVVLDDKIYAIGGKGANNVSLPSMEMYSVSDGWKLINDEITPRNLAAAVVLNGKIFVMGGSFGGYLKLVECYDTKTNCWTQCADMIEVHRGTPEATVHKGQIFVVGGLKETSSSATVERYDPQRNQWTKICSLNIALQLVSCVSLDNQLWAVGGYDKSYTNAVSVYDDQNDKWIPKNPILFCGYYYCFTVPKSLLQDE